jgi:hypothetical protein
MQSSNWVVVDSELGHCRASGSGSVSGERIIWPGCSLLLGKWLPISPLSGSNPEALAISAQQINFL